MVHESANIEIIRNTRESIKRSFDLVESASDEVLRIFSSINCISSPSTDWSTSLIQRINRAWCKS